MKLKQHLNEKQKIEDDELVEWLLTYLALKTEFGTYPCGQIKKDAMHDDIKVSPQRIRKVMEKYGLAKGTKSSQGYASITGSRTQQFSFTPSEICLTKAGKQKVLDRFKKKYKYDDVIVGGKLLKKDKFIKKIEQEIRDDK